MPIERHVQTFLDPIAYPYHWTVAGPQRVKLVGDLMPRGEYQVARQPMPDEHDDFSPASADAHAWAQEMRDRPALRHFLDP